MDRRVKRTKKRLKEALIELLNIKNVKSVTVSELALKADINRGTFYTHFRDAEDLLSSIVDELMEDAEQCFNRSVSRDVLERFFGVLDLEREFVKVMFLEPYFAGFSSKLEEVILNGCRSRWRIDERNRKLVTDYAYRYIAGGLCAMAFEWIRSNDIRSCAEMAVLSEVFISSNIKAVQ